MALQPRTRRDTPAQDSTFQRREQTFRRDMSALQEAGLQAQDRDNENDAIANVVRNTTSTMPDNFGNSGSPTLRRAGQSAIEGARSGAQRAQQWRTDTLREDTAGGAGFPSSSATVGRTMDRMRGNAPPAARGAGPQTTEASRTPGAEPGTLRSALSAVGEFFSGSDGPTRDLNIGRDGWAPSAGIDFHRQIGGGSAPPDGRGQSTPGATGAPAQPPSQLDPTALGMARGVGGGQGYAIGPDGRTTFYEGTQRNNGPANLSVMNSGGGGNAAAEFARANSIRQEYIDSQRPQNQVTVLSGETPLDAAMGGRGNPVERQIQRLVRDAGSTRDPWQRAAINRQIQQLQGVADRGATQSEGAADRQNTLQAQALRNQGAMATTLAGQSGGTVNPYDAARAQQVMQELQQGEQADYPTYDPKEIEAIRALPTPELQQAALQQYTQRIDQQFAGAQLDNMLAGRGASRQDALESYQAGELDPNSELGMLIQRVYAGVQPPTENMAEGGLVPEFSAIGFAQGGMVPDQYGAQMGPGMDMGSAVGMGAPGHQGIDLMQVEYDQYAQGAQQLGVPAIPFEEFVGLKQQSIPQPPGAPGSGQPMTGAMQSAVRMAQGGMVPGQDSSDASGKMLVDSDPDAPQDSIPAVIDGTRPAKLDSGEFVIPRDVVLFYGTDKLNKMIEQAKEKGQGNGTQPGSASAVQQSAPPAGR